MLLPLLLIALAVICSTVVAYGTHPALAQFSHGLGLILLSYRIQWPMIAGALLLCLILLFLVISGRRRAWWLIGLAPVLALFAHRFSTGHLSRLSICDEPAFLTADAAGVIHDEDYVVGVSFGEGFYAYPYAVLYSSPVIVQSDRERRMVLIWSAGANCACASMVTRDIKARQLEIVSMPANVLLLYNARFGQFINGLSGRTSAGAKPRGFLAPLPVSKVTWQAWRKAHPETRLMTAGAAALASGPSRPVLPQAPLAPQQGGPEAQTPVVLIATTQPVALREMGDFPVNFSAGGTPVLLFRDKTTGAVRAFDRHIEADLAPRFSLNRDSRRKGMFIDADTNTGWSSAGVAVDGEKHRLGRRLTPIDAQEDVYWGVAKYWFPELKLIRPPAGADAAGPSPATRPAEHRPVAPRRRRR
jgi:hypothetical protein